MTSKAFAIAFKLGAKLNNSYANAFSKAESIASKTVSKIAKIATGIAASIGVGSLLKDSTESFIQFENKMNEVFTLLPGISQEAMDKMNAQAMKFSKDFGVLPEQTVPALEGV